MNEIMKNIVWSEEVQYLLEETMELIAEKIITKEKYIEICNEVQRTINSEPERYILEPFEVAYIIEEAVMIYSNKKKNTNFPLSNVEKSVELAFIKQVGRETSLEDDEYSTPSFR